MRNLALDYLVYKLHDEKGKNNMEKRAAYALRSFTTTTIFYFMH